MTTGLCASFSSPFLAVSTISFGNSDIIGGGYTAGRETGKEMRDLNGENILMEATSNSVFSGDSLFDSCREAFKAMREFAIHYDKL